MKGKQKKNSPWVLILAGIFILIGIGALVYPIVGDLIASQQRSTAVAHYDRSLDKISKEEIQKKLKEAKEYNDNIYAQQQGEVTPYPNIKYEQTINVDGVMATLDIPAIGIKEMPVFHGTNELTLNTGLGHFKPSSVPIGGKNTRSVISGHSGLQNQVLFTNVKKLKVGDVFYVNVLKKKLAYQIQSIDEVLPSQVDKVKIENNKDMVTLVTCTPPGINTYRLLVNGVRIPYEQAKKEKVASRDTFSYTKIVIASLIFCVFLSLILFVIYRLFKRSVKQAKDEKSKQKAQKRLKRLFISVKILFVTMILIMIGILGYAIYGYTQIQTQSSMKPINIGKTEQLANYNLDKINRGNYTETDVTSVNLGNYTTAKVDFNRTVNDWGIGKLSIPSLSINLPILAGMNNENLLNGVATYNGSQQLGKGNYVLLSHNIPDSKGNANPVLLGKLNQVKIGTKIYASDFRNLFVYEVNNNQVVRETETQYITQPQQSVDPPIITLVRCEGGMGTEFRRIVQGKLLHTTPINSLKANEISSLGLSKEVRKESSQIYSGKSYSTFVKLAMLFAASIISDPIQSFIPIVLLLMVPIIFLNII